MQVFNRIFFFIKKRFFFFAIFIFLILYYFLRFLTYIDPMYVYDYNLLKELYFMGHTFKIMVNTIMIF